MDTLRNNEIKSIPIFNKYKRNKLKKMMDERYDEKIIQKVEMVLQTMSAEKADLIRRDYLVPGKKKWWEGFYSKSTYYRMKGKALEEFLFFLK